MAPGDLLLRMEGIDKHFPGVHALDHVDFDLHEGEVHALLGENGAGKSTLMKILSGVIERDSGRIVIQGKEIGSLTPSYAQELGIGMVHQELSLIPALSVAENVLLGRLPRNALGLINWPGAYQRAAESLAKLGVNIDPRARVRDLNVAEQQLTEIARVLSREGRILVLDEPTSALSNTERDKLFEIIRRLQAQGVGIIYISHQLDEVLEIGQRITVLRDGKLAGSLPIDQADKDTVIQMMIGRRLVDQFPKEQITQGRTILRVENLSTPDLLRGISFELRQGEILGIFGLMGAGQAELARALFGLLPLSSGRIYVNEQEVQIRRPADAIQLGLGFLTRDRREGLVPMQSLPPNITLPNIGRLPITRFLNLSKERATTEEFVRDLKIRPPILSRPVMFLSGGNQQKVVLARWLCSQAKIMIFDEPTRGIDVGAKAEVFALMNQLIQAGVGIIMISSELPEIVAMADQVLVMRAGRIVAAFQRGEVSQQKLLQSAS